MTPEHLIVPYEEFGPVRLEWSLDEVVAALGPPDGDYKGHDGQTRHLSYYSHALGLDFDLSGRLHLVDAMVTPPPLCIPFLADGLALVGDIDALAGELAARGHQLKVGARRDEDGAVTFHDDDTIYCESLGLAFWRDDSHWPVIDSVTAWSAADRRSPEEAAAGVPWYERQQGLRLQLARDLGARSGPELLLVPYERFGPIAFGASVAEVIEAAGLPEAANEHFLAYDRLGARVHFDAQGEVRAIVARVTPPPPCTPVLADGLELMGDVRALAAQLAARGHRLAAGTLERGDDDYVFCASLGVALWRNDPRFPIVDLVWAWSRRDREMAERAASAVPVSDYGDLLVRPE